LSGLAPCAKLTTMPCPLCQQRQARRQCPALGREICAVCCGTKRLGEIACPPACGYLAAAQAHPPASVRRQQERDLAFVMAMRDGLSPTQSDLYWAVLTFVAGFRSDPLLAVIDEDVAEGAAALAATYETASRGLIYEHRPRSLVAQRLVTDMRAFLDGLVAEADTATARQMERDAPTVLRHLERGAREKREGVDRGAATALEIIARVVTAAARDRETTREEPRADASRSMLVRP
jgi:hypothetical protein